MSRCEWCLGPILGEFVSTSVGRFHRVGCWFDYLWVNHHYKDQGGDESRTGGGG